jgi:hypothetical protein
VANCQGAASALNNLLSQAYGGSPNITVNEFQKEVSNFHLFDPDTWFGDNSTKTVTRARLSTGESDFNFGRDKYTEGLYDVIKSEEITFDLGLVPGNSEMPNTPGATASEIQGRNYARPEGGTVLVSADGNRLNEHTGVVLMHELVGHGHPAGGPDAHAINRYYQRRLGYTLSGPRGIPHGGYKSEIGWTRTGLWLGR